MLMKMTQMIMMRVMMMVMMMRMQRTMMMIATVMQRLTNIMVSWINNEKPRHFFGVKIIKTFNDFLIAGLSNCLFMCH